MIIWLLTIFIVGFITWNIFAIYAVCSLDGIIFDICEIYFKAIWCILVMFVLLVFSYGISYGILEAVCEAKGNDAKYCEVIK